MSLRVVALLRVSTDAQANHGASLDAQARRFDELVTLNRWHVCARLRGCESASKAGHEREVLQAALRAIREHDADAIYVHEQSRLTRGDELEAALLMRELRERSCKVIINGAIRDLESIDERFVLRIQAVVDRAESERIVERSKRGKREKARQGRWTTGQAPFGYRNPAKTEPGRGVLVIVPEDAAIIRRIFALVAQGQTVNSIRDMLNRESVPTSSGEGRWGNSALWRMIVNPVYIGTIEANRWRHDGGRITAQPAQIVVHSAHEPIIDRATWDRVQKRLTKAPRRGVEPALLTGLLHANGRRLTGDSNGTRRFYYAKGGPYIVRDHAEAVVWDGFKRMIDSPQWLQEICTAAASADDRPVDHEAIIRQQSALVAKLQRRLDGLTTMRADGEIGRSEFQTRADEINQQIQAAQNMIRDCQPRPATPELGDEMKRAVIAAKEILRMPIEPKIRRRLIESLVERVDAVAEKDRKSRQWIIRDLTVGLWNADDRRRAITQTRVVLLIDAVPVMRIEHRPVVLIKSRFTAGVRTA